MIIFCYRLCGHYGVTNLRYFHTVAKFQYMTKVAEYIKIAQPGEVNYIINELGVGYRMNGDRK